MDFFINNIDKSSLEGYDLPASVTKPDGRRTEYNNKVAITKIRTIEQEIIRSARMSSRYY